MRWNEDRQWLRNSRRSSRAASLAVGSSAVINSPRTGQGSAPIQQDTCRQNTNWPKARKSAIGPFHRSNNQAQPMPQPHIVVADKQQSLRRDSIWRAIPSLREQSKSVIIHTLRTIQTSSTITIMVPSSPNPSISFLLYDAQSPCSEHAKDRRYLEGIVQRRVVIAVTHP